MALQRQADESGWITDSACNDRDYCASKLVPRVKSDKAISIPIGAD